MPATPPLRDNALVFELLNAQVLGLPWLAEMEWIIRSGAATATTDLGGLRTGPTGELIMQQPPDVLPIINALHDAGWKRGEFDVGRPQQSVSRWLRAYIRNGADALLIVSGVTYTPWGDGKNPDLPYFADPVPEFPDMGETKDWRAEFAEWQRKTQEDEW